MKKINSYENKKKKTDSRPRKQFDSIYNIKNLIIKDRIGQGHFSEVFSGFYKDNPCAIKVIERGNENVISTEIQILNKLKGCPNIIDLIDVINDETTIIIFELVDSIKIDDFYKKVTPLTLKLFLHNILEALNFAHINGIIHRDVKMGNILISKDLKKIKLIDWGCGTFISHSMSSRAGSRTIRSPEMLLGFKDYSYYGDSWAFGVLILSILTKGIIPWKKQSSEENLISLSKYFGSKKIKKLSLLIELPIQSNLMSELYVSPKFNLNDLFDESMNNLINSDLLDLMDSFLEINFQKRISPKDALNHKYFK